MEAHVAFADVKVDEYAAVLILGGRAPEYLRNNARLLDLIRDFDRQGKWIFAICHGVQILRDRRAGPRQTRDLLRACSPGS